MAELRRQAGLRLPEALVAGWLERANPALGGEPPELLASAREPGFQAALTALREQAAWLAAGLEQVREPLLLWSWAFGRQAALEGLPPLLAHAHPQLGQLVRRQLQTIAQRVGTRS